MLSEILSVARTVFFPPLDESDGRIGMQRFASLGPETLKVAEQATRIDRNDQVECVLQLYQDLYDSDANSGLLLFLGESAHGPDDFALRLSLLEAEMDTFDEPETTPDGAWPNRDQILNSLERFDPLNYRDDLGQFRSWLAGKCGSDANDLTSLLLQAGETHELCIFVFKVNPIDADNKCILEHVSRMLMSTKEATSGKYIFVYWIVTDGLEKKHSELRSSQKLISNYKKNERYININGERPCAIIDKWSKIEQNDIKDWRNKLDPYFVRFPGLEPAIKNVLSKIPHNKGVFFSDAVEQIVDSLRKTEQEKRAA